MTRSAAERYDEAMEAAWRQHQSDEIDLRLAQRAHGTAAIEAAVAEERQLWIAAIHHSRQTGDPLAPPLQIAFDQGVAEERARCAAVARAEPEPDDDAPEAVIITMESVGVVRAARAAVRVTKRCIAEAIERGDEPGAG